MKRFLYCLSFILSYPLFYSGPAFAHPHVFIDAKLKIIINKDAVVENLIEDWHFDPIFSAGVLMDFSKNKKTLSPKEQKKLHDTIYKSMAYFGYFQSIESQGKKITISPPHVFKVTYENAVQIHLEAKPKQPLKLEKNKEYNFRVFDPSFYVNVAYNNDKDIQIQGLPNYCKAKIIHPNADQILTQDAQTLPEDFFTDPTNAFDLASQLATKVTITCSN